MEQEMEGSLPEYAVSYLLSAIPFLLSAAYCLLSVLCFCGLLSAVCSCCMLV
jgi:hypothetical protein